MREYAQGTQTSVIPRDRTKRHSVTNALIYFCEYARGQHRNDDVYRNLSLARERIESWWNESIAQDDFVDSRPFLPTCTYSRMLNDGLVHCEGRAGLTFVSIKTNDQIDRGAGKWVRTSPAECYCPRTSSKCPSDNGLFPDKSKPWWMWSLNEVLSDCNLSFADLANENFMPPQDGDLFINRLSGIANRVNEIRDRLKCRGCGSRLTYQLKYAKNPAKYMTTVTEPCGTNSGDCDGSVYINHCLGCQEIIDSRESPVHREGMYVCIHCATANNAQTAGRTCPKCGKDNTLKGTGRDRTCTSCGHSVVLPGRAT